MNLLPVSSFESWLNRDFRESAAFLDLLDAQVRPYNTAVADLCRAPYERLLQYGTAMTGIGRECVGELATALAQLDAESLRKLADEVPSALRSQDYTFCVRLFTMAKVVKRFNEHRERGTFADVESRAIGDYINRITNRRSQGCFAGDVVYYLLPAALNVSEEGLIVAREFAQTLSESNYLREEINGTISRVWRFSMTQELLQNNRIDDAFRLHSGTIMYRDSYDTRGYNMIFDTLFSRGAFRKAEELVDALQVDYVYRRRLYIIIAEALITRNVVDFEAGEGLYEELNCIKDLNVRVREGTLMRDESVVLHPRVAAYGLGGFEIQRRADPIPPAEAAAPPAPPQAVRSEVRQAATTDEIVIDELDAAAAAPTDARAARRAERAARRVVEPEDEIEIAPPSGESRARPSERASSIWDSFMQRVEDVALWFNFNFPFVHRWIRSCLRACGR